MDRAPSIDALKQVLADVYILALMTQNAHWNMVGPSFIGLHKLFEDQYGELIAMTDELAERIRALGDTTPAGMQDFLELASIEEPGTLNEELGALNTLHAAHKKLSMLVLEHISEIEPLGDVGTGDLLTELLRYIDKQAWLLGSHL